MIPKGEHCGGLPFMRFAGPGPEQIGRTSWRAGMSIVACGVRVGIRINKPEFPDRVLALIPDIWKPSSTPMVRRLFSLRIGTFGLRRNGRSTHQLYEDHRLATESKDLDWVLETFERRLKTYLAETARRRTFVHAGAVGWQGKAILIPGRSFSGKTSLVSALVRAGATYYSDEYAVLDTHGLVHPYSAPLALRDKETLKQKSYRADELGGCAGSKPLPVGLIVVSPYKAASCWRPRPLSAGEAVLELLANTIPARRMPEVVLPTLRRAVAHAVALKTFRGEAEETARLILGMSNFDTQDGSG